MPLLLAPLESGNTGKKEWSLSCRTLSRTAKGVPRRPLGRLLQMRGSLSTT